MLESALGSSASLTDLAANLGRACLADQRLLQVNLENPDVYETVEDLAALVRTTRQAAWQQAPANGYAELLDDTAITANVEALRSLTPAAELGILRGLCSGPLPLFFEGFRGRLALQKGMPIPNATRPVNKLFGARCTPYQQTLTSRDLLGRTGFDLYLEIDSGLDVAIDFSHADALDQLTWPKGRLPRVGTIHPRLDGDRIAYRLRGNRIFDVKPSAWSLEWTLKQLNAIKSAHIALLPELCLPSADALESALAADPSRYPAIVVAGSAHDRQGGAQVNESRVYLKGELVLRHRKIHPLQTQTLGNERFAEPIREDLRPQQREITLLSGEKSRMAVLICADLNDGSIPLVLKNCGVNLLLVPSLTFQAGAFNGNVCLLASHCQALSVVANSVLDKVEGEPHAPFLVLVGVPVSDAIGQSRDYFRQPAQTGVLAVLDPNRPLASALTWKRPS